MTEQLKHLLVFIKCYSETSNKRYIPSTVSSNPRKQIYLLEQDVLGPSQASMMDFF